MMGTVAVDYGPYPGAADGALDRLEAVYMAIARAQVAVGHVLVGLIGPCLQLLVL